MLNFSNRPRTIHSFGWIACASAVAFTAAATSAAWVPTAGGTYEWTDPTNWSEPGYPDGQSVAADLGSTDIAGYITVALNADITLGSLAIGDAATPTRAYTIAPGTTSPGSLTFDNAGSAASLVRVATASNSSTTSQRDVITAPIHLNDTLQITDNVGGNALRIMGDIDSTAASGTQYIHLSAGHVTIGGESGDATLNGAISDGSTGGKIGIMVTGGATLELLRPNSQEYGQADNTFTGDVYVKAGTLRIVDNHWTHQRVLPDAGHIYLGDSTGSADATFIIGDSGMTQANNITIVGGNTGITTLQFNNTSEATLTGTLDLNHDLNIHNTSSQFEYTRSYIRGQITGVGNIAITTDASDVDPTTGHGPNRVEFAGSDANTYVGTVTVTHGTLVLAKPDGVAAVTGDIILGSQGALMFSNAFQAGDNQIPDTAAIYAAADSMIYMNGQLDTIYALNINGAWMPAGTYGAPGSGADYSPSQFIGTSGILTVSVQPVPEPATVALLALGGLLMTTRRRRV